MMLFVWLLFFLIRVLIRPSRAAAVMTAVCNRQCSYRASPSVGSSTVSPGQKPDLCRRLQHDALWALSRFGISAGSALF